MEPMIGLTPKKPVCLKSGRECLHVYASLPGSFRDNETSRNEKVTSMIFCYFNKHKVTKYICYVNKLLCRVVQSRYRPISRNEFRFCNLQKSCMLLIIRRCRILRFCLRLSLVTSIYCLVC